MHDSSSFPVHISAEGRTEKTQTVEHGYYRFSVIKDGVIRIEFNADKRFVDEITQTIWFRHQGQIPFEQRVETEGIVIETTRFSLTCHDPLSVEDGAYSIVCKSTGYRYTWGEKLAMLPGTARTLDRASGMIPLGTSVISRTGIALLDDSESLRLDEHGWPQPNPFKRYDVYAFVFGHDYLDALKAYYDIAGRVPLIPRYMLGNWWSKYHPYTDKTLLAVVDGFKAEKIPLSVAIVDMDWHITAIDGVQSYYEGWTGYTVNENYFPDFEGFIEKLHARHVRTSLNLHPAGGVKPYESRYRTFADRVGVDPNQKKTIMFDSADPVHMKAYFEILLHPFEAMGVDFWWIDWQQGNHSKTEGLDPLWMLNHLHYHDAGRDGIKRPVTFSRWSDKGAQRYPIGFSGDTVIDWKSLHFQPYFTASASNIGFSLWSHDIGGHMGGKEEPELYLRWLQLGCFSPINRIHASSQRMSIREPWRHEEPYRTALGNVMRLRFKLIPYLYTAAYLNHAENRPMVLPLYYLEPENEAAYQYKNTYLFGSELIIHPVTKPLDPKTRRVIDRVYLPKGRWTNIFTGESYDGGKAQMMIFDLFDFGVYAKAGAIIPLDGGPGRNHPDNPEHLCLWVYPGDTNSYTLYEDDGETIAYRKGDAFRTTFTLNQEEDQLVFRILPDTQKKAYIPVSRRFEIVFHGIEGVVDDYPSEQTSDHLIVTLERVSSTEKSVIILNEVRRIDPKHFIMRQVEKTLIGMKLNPDDKTAIITAFETNRGRKYMETLLKQVDPSNRRLLLLYHTKLKAVQGGNTDEEISRYQR